ncbi:MAG: hypothetical protein LBI69_00030 [Puniceicoccales bacterium]|nr:hypothetical protein [Puniceicoccales bacterium]
MNIFLFLDVNAVEMGPPPGSAASMQMSTMAAALTSGRGIAETVMPVEKFYF